MVIRASVCCLAAFSFWLNVSTARGQGGVIFANNGPGWAEPWYGLGATNGLYASAECFSLFGIVAGGGPLAGDEFTAELWGMPAGSSEGDLQFLARTTFRTGTAAGLLVRPPNPVLVPFAQTGQRVALQLRVYWNGGGQLTSWDAARSDTGGLTATSELFISEPLGDTPVTLKGMGSYCLTTDFIRLPVPVLSFSTGGIRSWWTPIPLVYWEPVSGYRSQVAGDTVTLKVEVPNRASSVTWRYNGIDLPGQTNQTLVLSNIQTGQSGVYSARTTAISTFGAATNSIRLEVTPRPVLEEPARDVTGTFTARVRGVTNRSVAIESSTDLQNWLRGPAQPVGGRYSCTGNTVTNPPLFGPQLFYRAVVLT